jgi:hypothetical protein
MSTLTHNLLSYVLTAYAGMNYHSAPRTTWQAEQQQAWISDDRRPNIVVAANAQVSGDVSEGPSNDM